MPISFTINEGLGVFLSSYVGDITDSSLLLSYQQLFEGGKWNPGFHEIVDARNVQPCGITHNGLYNLSLLIKRYTDGKCERFKAAIIAPETIASGLAHFYEVVSVESLKDVMIFEEPTKALKWIGVDADVFPQLHHEESANS